MDNKFLERYPLLWEPEVGDIVRILKLPNHFKRLVISSTGEIIKAHGSIYDIKLSGIGIEIFYFFCRAEIELVSRG